MADNMIRKCDDCGRTFVAWMLQPWGGRWLCLSCVAREKRMARHA